MAEFNMGPNIPNGPNPSAVPQTKSPCLFYEPFPRLHLEAHTPNHWEYKEMEGKKGRERRRGNVPLAVPEQHFHQ